ncbi:Phosphatidylglycerophosphate synthase [Nitrosospira sp. Nsp11]|uniref:CDP-alcohol phosphatidyltransferase family protein n=1 Tax=Nitrosospira sp. Nsp11 TaxID=1855338 RepID=UPI00091DC5D3|nr:CDP-alcohol phosphatidyltransferase family protein [Nitrosospira sp. Nsp11]SHM09459.1 Phosphatidylglycerophosphate synthase [Nitrosospira sp. Nsp11]
MSKPVYIYIVGDSETNIWGLSGRERLQRMLKPSLQTRLVDDPEQIPVHASALLLRADHLFDGRVLAALINAKTNLVLGSNQGQPVAIRVINGDVHHVLANFVDGGDGRTFSDFPLYALKDLDLSSLRQNLKKRDPPYVFPINNDNRKMLESELFTRSYKGVTDLVTKWLWPVPAFLTVRFCVRFGIRPNHVTLLSLVFAVLAGVAFWHSYYGPGLVMGWLMTFLDTVDGKLARVTVTSSRLGDVLDHGLDIIHPPLWYIAWGVGLATALTPPFTLAVLFWLILIGYIGGRLCEGAFQFWVGSFDIFIWRPLDSFSRLITARRNPNLLLLTFGWFIDRPDIGLCSVVAWHLVSTAFLAVRLVMGWQARRFQGPLRSWFEEIVPGRDDGKLAVRIFVPLTVKVNDRKVTHG